MTHQLALQADLQSPKFFNEKSNIVFFSKKSPAKDTCNEDAVGVFETPIGYVLAVADGAGGHPKGEEAAALVLRNIETSLKQVEKGQDNHRSLIVDAIEKTNKDLIAGGNGARTTITVCEVVQDRARGFQVGDSTLLICGQRGKLKYRSLAHSPVGYGVEAGLIDENEALQHPDLHYISNLVGESDMKIEIGPEVELNSYDTIFLASDGIFDNISPEQVVEQVRKGTTEEIATSLMTMITDKIYNKEDSKKDDISFVLFKK
jgi:serine/threonine protein phosphatase PrpC